MDGIAHAIRRSEFARDFSPLLTLLEGSGKQTVDLNDLVALSNQAIVEQRKPSVDSERTVSKGMCLVVLGRCYVHMQTQSESSSRTVEALRVLKAAMDLFKVKDLPEGEEEEDDEDLSKLSKEARAARADLCCAMAEYNAKTADVADETLDRRSKEAADEWLLGEEGQEAVRQVSRSLLFRLFAETTNMMIFCAHITQLKLLTRELTEKAVASGDASSSSSKNIIELRRASEARATTRLINETAKSVKEQLIASSANGDITAGGQKFRESAVEWLVRAWVLRESIHKRDEPELGLMYERLGEAHMACKTVENYEEGTYFIKPFCFSSEESIATATNTYHIFI